MTIVICFDRSTWCVCVLSSTLLERVWTHVWPTIRSHGHSEFNEIFFLHLVDISIGRSISLFWDDLVLLFLMVDDEHRWYHVWLMVFYMRTFNQRSNFIPRRFNEFDWVNFWGLLVANQKLLPICSCWLGEIVTLISIPVSIRRNFVTCSREFFMWSVLSRNLRSTQ